MLVRRSKTTTACLALAVLLLILAVRSAPLRANAPIVVTTADDNDLPGSLRWAIEQANMRPGPDTIVFQIPLQNLHKIWVTAKALPDITDEVVIDGHSQQGCCPDGGLEPIIELDGSAAGDKADGLTITSNNSTVQSLVITRFSGAGIHITGSASGNHIYNCRIGMNHGDFLLPYPNYDDQVRNEVGVLIDGDATSNRIGDADAQFTSFDRNIITGNKHGGVRIEGNANTNAVINNYIGTDPGANVVLRNGNPVPFATYGVEITGNAQNNWIGSAPGLPTGNAAFGNVIAGGVYGVLLDGAAGNYVQDNHIGTDKVGSVALPNFEGIGIIHGALDNVIGGTDKYDQPYTFGNIITLNQQAGILVVDDQTHGNSIRYNSIFDNGTDAGFDPNNFDPRTPTLGIQLGLTASRLPNDNPGDADSGPNHLQNWPTVGLVVNEDPFSTTTYGSIFTDPGDYAIDVYWSTTCHGRLPGLSNAQQWYGSAAVTVDGSGMAEYSVRINGVMPGNLFITAIATTADGSSSEISPCHAVNQASTANIAALPGPPISNGNGTGGFSVSLRNDGPNAARNVVLADNLPPGLTLAGCRASHGGVCGGAGNHRLVSFRALAPGEVVTVAMSVTLDPVVVVPPGDTVGGVGQVVSAAGGAAGGGPATAPPTFTNTVMVTSDTFDPDLSDNLVTMTLTIGGPDVQPPVIGRAAAHPDELWPPDGRLRHVHVSYAATDNVDAPEALSCSLSVGGAGVTATDAEVLDAHDVRLRASRRGQGPREYDITISCADHAGNIGTGTVRLPVAREEGRQ